MNKRLTRNPHARGLIFDIDGTICDTMPVHYRAWRQTAEQHGIDFTPALFYEMAGIPALQTSQALKKRFGIEFDEVEFTRIKEARFEEHMDKAKPIDAVVDLIRACKGKIPMACGTGSSQYLAWKTLEIAGVKDCFEHVVAAEDVEKHKPFPDTFLKAAELIGVAPEFCEVYEDGKLGLIAAQRAGMMWVDVTHHYQVSIG